MMTKMNDDRLKLRRGFYHDHQKGIKAFINRSIDDACARHRVGHSRHKMKSHRREAISSSENLLPSHHLIDRQTPEAGVGLVIHNSTTTLIL